MPRSPRSQPRGHVSRPWPREGRGEPGSCACSRERLPWRRHGHRRSSRARGRGRGSEMFPEGGGATSVCLLVQTLSRSFYFPIIVTHPLSRPRWALRALAGECGQEGRSGSGAAPPAASGFGGGLGRVPADTERHRTHFQRSVPWGEPHSPRRAAGAARLSKVSSPRLPPAWAMLGVPPPSISAEKSRGRSSRGGPGPQAAGRGQRWAGDPVA